MIKAVIGLTFGFLLWMTFPAQAQNKCGPYTQIQGFLTTSPFNEQVAHLGDFGEVGVMEIWRDLTKGTFTIIIRSVENPDIACLIASGTKWRDSTAPKYIPGKDS